MVRKLNDKDLIILIKSRVKQEKQIVAVILESLQEINERRLYAEYAPSLRKFCVKVLGYTDAEAGIRVSAVYATTRAPEIKKKIEKGSISLTSAAALGIFFRHNNPENKLEIIKKIENRSIEQTKEILNSMSSNPAPKRVKITLEERVLKKLKKIQTDFDDCNELEAIEALIDRYLEKKNQARAKRVSKGSEQQRYLSRDVKEHVNRRSGGRCEGISEITSERCIARIGLQFDHVRAISIGGKSTKENVRKLCFSCNQRAAVKQLGLKKMQGGAIKATAK